MGSDQAQASGPDLTQGIPLADLKEGTPLLGQVRGEAVMLVRRGQEVFAVGATCTHYSGPLAEGLVVGETVRCPWHHACFSLRSGEALRAPALNPVSCWRVEQQNGMAFVREKIEAAKPPLPQAPAAAKKAIVIVGGGAAGNAAAELLRREGHTGRITLLSADDALPYDRPNLSKNYLAGTAPEEWIPLRSADFYKEHGIDLRLNTRVSRGAHPDGSGLARTTRPA